MNLSDLTKSPFVQESTLHGISHLRYTRSRARITFWLIVTFLAMGYAGYEIAREINHISSGVKFETTYRLAQINEIQFPVMEYCYSNPFDIFDWRIVSDYMAEFNWTTEDVGHLLAAYPLFQNLAFKSRNVSIQHVHQLGNITLETFVPMIRKICRHQNLTNGSPLQLFNRNEMMTCIPINCLPLQNNTPDALTLNLRMSIIDFMWKVHGLSVVVGYEDYLFAGKPHNVLTLLQVNSINAFSVDPVMVNAPTVEQVHCYKENCNSQVQKSPCTNYSVSIVQERGIDCFQWKYTIHKLADGEIRFLKNIRNTIELLLLYPTYEEWQVREYRPLSLWYETLSNIGGTLSVWTGASVLSFLHLLEVFCYMCYKRRWKVGDNSQLAEAVV